MIEDNIVGINDDNSSLEWNSSDVILGAE